MINNIKELTKQGLTLVDMHTHTRLSDGAHHYEQAIEKAKREGIGLCITDHNEIRGSLKVEGVFTLYGAEITTKELYDILLYFSSKKSLSEFYSKYLENARIKEFGFRFHKTKISTAELLDYAKDFNALTIIAHPHTYHPKKSYNFFDENKALLKKVDAIEGFNAMMPKNANPKAIQWAEELSKPMIGSSDAHRLKIVGQGLTACYAETRDEFITQILKNKSMIFGKELPLATKIIESLHIQYRNIKLF